MFWGNEGTTLPPAKQNRREMLKMSRFWGPPKKSLEARGSWKMETPFENLALLMHNIFLMIFKSDAGSKGYETRASRV